MANYEVESVDLAVNIAGEAGVTANMSDVQPLAVTFGTSVKIDVGQVVTNIQSGKAEVQAAAADALAEFNTNAAVKTIAYNDNATDKTNTFNNNAATSINLAKDWATKTDGTVDENDYSAKYYALQATNMADKDLSNLSATGEAKFTAKQDVISDLTTIRSGAAAGAMAVQPADLANVATSGSYGDLSSTPDLSVYAHDNSVVHLSTEETITGAKIFQNMVNIFGGINNFRLGYNKGDNLSNTLFCNGLLTTDAGKEKRIGAFTTKINADKSVVTEMVSYKCKYSTDTEYAGISMVFPSSGETYASIDGMLRPSTDNTKNLGDGSHRWKQLYAGTTTISTSDERLKQGIERVPTEVLEAWGEVEFYRYKFNDAVAEKGFETARYHTGMVAQRIESVFAAHGLNAFAYGLLCYDEWQEDNRYALRYEECLCMEAAYQRYRADKIEARLAALEARG